MTMVSAVIGSPLVVEDVARLLDLALSFEVLERGASLVDGDDAASRQLGCTL